MIILKFDPTIAYPAPSLIDTMDPIHHYTLYSRPLPNCIDQILDM